MSTSYDALQIIVIDDEEIVRHSMLQTLQLDGYNAQAYEDPLLAIKHCSINWPGVIICDVRMNIMNGLQVLEKVIAIDEEIPVIMFSAHADISTAIKAIRLGAYDFLEKTDDPQHHLNTVERAYQKRQLILENRRLKLSLSESKNIESKLVGQSSAIRQLRESILQLAQVDIDVIIHGATGTGKEVVARCLHDFGSRAKQPFVALNCGALSESVIESELFGHEAGAFTGATKRRTGKIEFANGGTLFLDEIESMPLALQIKLLRVIQERCIQRLGANTDIKVDIRIIAASKANLLAESNGGRFRDDLYYRLSVAAIHIPSLDERKTDIAILFSHFAQKSALKLKREQQDIPLSLIEKLNEKSWPGNVRELQNTAERWVLNLPLEFDLPSQSISNDRIGNNLRENKQGNIYDIDFAQQKHLDTILHNFESTVIQQALIENNGLIEKTAAFLNIPRKKLYLRMKKYQLDKQNYS